MYIAKESLMPLLKLIAFSILLAALPFSAQAQEVCGEPISLRQINPKAEKYCSVYERQLAYREERMKFRKMIEERREDFIAPQIAAQKKYKKDLEALHKNRSSDDDFHGR